MDPLWRIELLGWLRATSGERVVSRFRTRKAGALLAFLAYHPHRSHPRDALIEILWSESDLDSGRHSLRMALSSLRHQLEPPGVPPGAVILADRTSVQLNPAVITTDVARFEEALRAAEHACNPEERAQRLTGATARYRGPLLPGCDEAWVSPERERLAEASLRAIEQLVAHYEQREELAAALQWARRAVSADPLREEAHRNVIRLLDAAGQPDAALRQYETLERFLADELGAAPDAELQTLMRAIATPPGRVGRSQGEARARAREPLPPATGLPGPAVSQPAPAGSLPLQFTRFFGREEEIAELCDLLLSGETRLVTLTGPGGTGKTRLGLATAGRLREAIPGASWVVPLADLVDPRLIPDRTRDGLHLPGSPNLDPTEQVVAALARQPSLLLLDNLEHLLPECAPFVETLLERVGTLIVLVTSRQRLDVAGEREFPISPLPVPDGRRAEPEALLRCPSVQLFVDRAQSVRPDFQMTQRNAAAIAGLCERLEGLPLAIELAAARAWVLTPAQMLERLSHRFDLLTRRQHRGDPRHQSLRTALDWSYHLLSGEVQRFFARLCVFRGGWALAAAEAVCEEPQALEYLEELRSASLVLAEPDGEAIRFRMLETLREFGQERLEACGELAETRRRHAEYFLTLAEEAEARKGLDQMEREHDNLRAALAWFVQSGEAEAGLRLGGALWYFWNVRGYLTEGRTHLAALLALPAVARTPERAKGLYGAAVLAAHQADYPAASALYEETAALARVLDDKRTLARSLSGLAEVLYSQGDCRTARALVEESLAIGREVGDKRSIASSLGCLGSLAGHQGDSATDWTLKEQSLAIGRELGDAGIVTSALGSLGSIAEARGDYETARALYEEHLAIRREIGDRLGLTGSLNNLGSLAFCQGDYAVAQAFYAESQAIARELDSKSGIAWAFVGLGDIALYQGDLERAETLFEESLVLFRELGDSAVAGSLKSLGDVARLQRNYEQAAVRYRESLSLFQALEYVPNTTCLLEALATLATAQGQAERAARLFGAAAVVVEATGVFRTPSEHADHERHVAATRAALGEEAFAAAWVVGRALTLEEAICTALAEDEIPTTL